MDICISIYEFLNVNLQLAPHKGKWPYVAVIQDLHGLRKNGYCIKAVQGDKKPRGTNYQHNMNLKTK